MTRPRSPLPEEGCDGSSLRSICTTQSAWDGPASTEHLVRPDYDGGSIVNLMRSVADACGAAPLPYMPLRGLQSKALAAARNIVLLVVDGLGFNHLQRTGAGGILHSRLHSRMTSVFPSTTASAVTTFLTGLAPQQHALTGWHMYFSELDSIAAVLPLTPRGEGQYAVPPGELPRRLFGHASLFERIARRAVIISPKYIAGSEFNTYHAGRAEIRGYKGFAEMFAQIEAAVREQRGPAYIYAYYPELDTLSHVHGVGSPQVASHFAELDEACGRFIGAIRGTDTLLLVTADHGFIDSPPERLIELEQHPQLAEMLVRPLCGERRIAYCYVKTDKAGQFEAYVREHLSEFAVLFRSEELVRQGWFGPGAPDPRLAGRIGNYALMMKAGWTIKDWLPDEKRHLQIGVHGGASADEMFVPLIVAEC